MAKRTLLNGVVNRVALVGIELEGGWDGPVAGEEIIGDGSVHFDPAPAPRRLATILAEDAAAAAQRTQQPIISPKYRKGEIASKNGMPVEMLADWMKQCYPQHVNHTCGLHVHMSFFHRLNYSRLLVPEFTPFIIESLKQWGTRACVPDDHMFWNRLNPEHPWTREHCRHEYLGDNQVTVKRKDYNSRGTDHSRYTFINYCDGQHRTIECRGLPMFGTTGQLVTTHDIEAATLAVMEVVNATNRYLSKMRQRERPVRIAVPEKCAVSQEFGSIIR